MYKKLIKIINYLIKNNNYNIVKFSDNSEFININNQDEYQESLKYISLYNN